jgi:hypothetical protein
MGSKRVDVNAILADADLRRKLMVSTIQATQAREGIDTTPEQADRAYYVVTEAERATFFSLRQFARGATDEREEAFVRTASGIDAVQSIGARYDVSRRDFMAVDGAPLVYAQVGVLGPLMRENARLDQTWADVRGGMNSTESERFVRYWWEPASTSKRRWVRYSKGGDFSRFYSDLDLVFDWTDDGRKFRAIVKSKYGSESRFVKSPEFYFRRGLTWTEKSSLGFSVRILEEGAIFNVAGPAAFPKAPTDEWYLLGVLNSELIAFSTWAISGRNYGASYVSAVPIAEPLASARAQVETIAKRIFQQKATWDERNETSSKFVEPWILSPGLDHAEGIFAKVAALSALEESGEKQLRDDYALLNAEVFRIYGIPEATQRHVLGVLGQRPPEVLWPQMEGKTTDQKRMEHVWRLLSYAVKRVLDADDDGIVLFGAVNGELRLVDRVRQELAGFFPGRDVNQVEVEVVNELKRTVKSYRKCQSLGEWLDNAFFDYHCGLYKSRPMFWHIASAQGTSPFAFGALVHYHRFDKNRMAKLRSTYLRDAIEEFRREAGLADKSGRSDDRLEWQTKVEETQALDKKLQLIQEGHHEGAEGGDRDYRILTPWKKPGERPKGWDPDFDDGVKVNIESFEKASVLRIGKVI